MQDKDEEPVELDTLEIDGTDPLDAPRPRYTEQKKTNKLFVTFLIFIIAAVLIAGGLSAYFFILRAPAPTTPTVAPDTQKPVSQKLTAKTLVEQARAVVNGDIKDSASAPPFRPNGYNFSVQPEIASGFEAKGAQSVIATDVTAIQNVLTSNQLKGTVVDPGSDIGIYYATYESTDIICSVSDQKPYNEPPTSTNYSALLGCANKSDYLANAAMLRPYFIIYASQSQFDTTHTLMSTPIVKTSKTEGYSTATVSISGSVYGSVGGFAGLFYVTPDKVLHYFTGTQSQIPCSKFSTDDLKKAYLGEQCYDETTNNDNATVKL